MGTLPHGWPEPKFTADWSEINHTLEALVKLAAVVTEKTLTEDQLCEVLHVSRESLLKCRRLKEDPMPAMKVGRRYLYDLGKVLEWAERQAQKPAFRRPLRRRIRRHEAAY